MGWGLSLALGEEQSVQRTGKGEVGGLLERGGTGSKADFTCFLILSGTKPALYLA